MKAKKLIPWIVGLVMIIGAGMIFYPTVSDWANSLTYVHTIDEYESQVEELDSDRYEEYLAAARAFNEDLFENGTTAGEYDPQRARQYEKLLNINGNGVMGYIKIPSVSISLPIYHGTSDESLLSGSGHLEGTSLPVGGENTHTAISGHRGLPSARLFTDIDRLENGDTFSLYVLGDVLTYQIDEIDVVLPSELSELKIVEGQDYCTLITCTPYGVNTHRLLIRGFRIPTPEDQQQGLVRIPPFGLPPELNNALILALVITIILVIVLAGLFIRRRKDRNGKNPLPRVPDLPKTPKR